MSDSQASKVFMFDLECGADPNAVTNHGATPTKLAKVLGWNKVIAPPGRQGCGWLDEEISSTKLESDPAGRRDAGQNAALGKQFLNDCALLDQPVRLAIGRLASDWRRIDPQAMIHRGEQVGGRDGAIGGCTAMGVAGAHNLPPETPPPARTTLQTPGQWSRPPDALIRGVRPNSPAATTRVVSSRPHRSRSSSKAENARSNVGSSSSGVIVQRAERRRAVAVPRQAVEHRVEHIDGDQRAPDSTSRQARRQFSPNAVRP